MILGIRRDPALQVDFPQVAECRHLDILLILKDPSNLREILHTVPHADMTQRDAVVRAQYTAVGKRGGRQGSSKRGLDTSILASEAPPLGCHCPRV